jgi:hypothetical protein
MHVKSTDVPNLVMVRGSTILGRATPRKKPGLRIKRNEVPLRLRIDSLFKKRGMSQGAQPFDVHAKGVGRSHFLMP